MNTMKTVCIASFAAIFMVACVHAQTTVPTSSKAQQNQLKQDAKAEKAQQKAHKQQGKSDKQQVKALKAEQKAAQKSAAMSPSTPQ